MIFALTSTACLLLFKAWSADINRTVAPLTAFNSRLHMPHFNQFSCFKYDIEKEPLTLNHWFFFLLFLLSLLCSHNIHSQNFEIIPEKIKPLPSASSSLVISFFPHTLPYSSPYLQKAFTQPLSYYVS